MGYQLAYVYRFVRKSGKVDPILPIDEKRDADRISTGVCITFTTANYLIRKVDLILPIDEKRDADVILLYV